MASETPRSYDIIIVGGGTAGLVLANRLSELPDIQVLVLEAGLNSNNDPKVAIPGFTTLNWADPNYDWCYKTVPQEAMNGRVLAQPRGKMLGGCSAINAMSTFYPSRKTFDQWARYGNPGWDGATLDSYMKKWEHIHIPVDEVLSKMNIDYLDQKAYGHSGPISVMYPKDEVPFASTWMATAQEHGFKTKIDPVAGEAVGAFVNPAYIDPITATRSHAGSAYWEPIKDRPNVHLLEGAIVSKILVDGGQGSQSLRARGVEYSVNGATKTVLASREVILSAGAFASPALLEMSGIGNPKILDPLGIGTVHVNTSVGENLQDHPMLFLSKEIIDPDLSLDTMVLPGRFEAAMAQYIEKKAGILANGWYCAGYFSTIDMDPAGREKYMDFVDKHTAHEDMSATDRISIDYLKALALSTTETTASIAPVPFGGKGEHGIVDGKYRMSMAINLLHVFSKGSTHIQSQSPTAEPLFDPKYLSHPLDLEMLARQILFAAKFFECEPFKSFFKPDGTTNVPAQFAGPSGFPETLDQAKEFAKATAATMYHASGTCAMRASELGGVVDNRLKVHGIAALRICDASIFPIIPKGPTTAIVYAMAERAADIIKEDIRQA